jgi:hypothetical protein
MLNNMKKINLLLILLVLVAATLNLKSENRPRVFVFTDINIDSGDPDDRQSLIHLLWYADELRIEGVVPDRWDARGLEACKMAADAYSKDYSKYSFNKKGFPPPEEINKLFAVDRGDAIRRFQKAASVSNDPLYVLIWGSMRLFGDALRSKPEVAENIRVITIGTDLMMEDYRQYIPPSWETTEKPCEQYNWNGHGRNEIFNDSRFHRMWWLEINWTYEGMFTGEEPREMFHKLSEYGNLGNHMKEVVKNEEWAQYFRVGDTPSVLYVIDPENDLNDPARGSWAGKFFKPFPKERPNYYADYNGPVEWNYNNPCETWKNHVAFRDHAKSTLENQRPQMYEALLSKLEILYHE